MHTIFLCSKPRRLLTSTRAGTHPNSYRRLKLLLMNSAITAKLLILSQAIRPDPNALAAQAKQDPAAIRDAIKTNTDGTFTVTFKGDKTHTVTIAAPTEAELALYNGGSSDGMWPAIMEKAFGPGTAIEGESTYVWKGEKVSLRISVNDDGVAEILLTNNDLFHAYMEWENTAVEEAAKEIAD